MSNNQRITAIYVTSDGGICKLNRAAMKEVVENGTYWADAGKWMSATFNHRTEHWSKLPKALYSNDGDYRVGSMESGHVVLDEEDAESITYYYDR